jgi:hypothetical protein
MSGGRRPAVGLALLDEDIEARTFQVLADSAYSIATPAPALIPPPPTHGRTLRCLADRADGPLPQAALPWHSHQRLLAPHRVAALNLRRLLNLGLNEQDHTWTLTGPSPA